MDMMAPYIQSPMSLFRSDTHSPGTVYQVMIDDHYTTNLLFACFMIKVVFYSVYLAATAAVYRSNIIV